MKKAISLVLILALVFGLTVNVANAKLVPKQASSLRLPRSGADDFTGT